MDDGFKSSVKYMTLNQFGISGFLEACIKPDKMFGVFSVFLFTFQNKSTPSVVYDTCSSVGRGQVELFFRSKESQNSLYENFQTKTYYFSDL